MEPFAKGAKPVTVLVAHGGVLPEELLAPVVEVLTERTVKAAACWAFR